MGVSRRMPEVCSDAGLEPLRDHMFEHFGIRMYLFP